MSTQKTSPANSVSGALNEAQSIIAAAERRANELRANSENAFEEAQRKGYEAGYAQGHLEACEQAIRLIKESAQVGEKLSEEAAKLALAISATVIGEQIKTSPSVVKKIAERALQQSVVGDAITIVSHPDDRPVLLESVDTFRKLAGGASVNIEEDVSVSRGGCIVRTEFGEVDASIPVLLDGIATQLGLSRK